MKPLDELIDLDDPGMPVVNSLLAEATRPFQLLPPSAANTQVLLGLQVTTRSTLGAIAHDTGGLLIDHGWLRMLGSGNARLPRNLLDWNTARGEGYLLVADDAAGGFFALNGGALGGDLGAMYYHAPDTLAWEALEIGYTDFLGWALSDRLSQFYQGLRWDSWQQDMRQVSANQCISFYPFLWTEEGSVATSRRTAVDVAEHYNLTVGQGS